MFPRILVPLDGSRLAEQVLPYARTVARRMRSRIELLAVNVPLGIDSKSLSQDEEHTALGAESSDREYLARVSAALRGSDLAVTSTTCDGSPASEIVKAAGKEPGTLIAMSTRGRSGITRWMLGSVTDKVLRAAENPLLIVRARMGESVPDDVKIGHVIVPLDGSPIAERLLPHAIAFAKAMRSGVSLIMVTPSPEEQDNRLQGRLSRTERRVYQKLDALAREYLAEVEGELRYQDIQSVEAHVLPGDPAEAILQSSRQIPDSIVAISTHGRSGMGRWLLGSVTDRVVRHSVVPVLVVRPVVGGNEKP